jgi:hypothetical protein
VFGYHLQELRQPALQPAALPVVLALLERVQPPHFSAQLLPALQVTIYRAGIGCPIVIVTTIMNSPHYTCVALILGSALQWDHLLLFTRS